MYDALNRLTAVIDQQGNAALYTYDSVGNILKIERFDATNIPGPIGITLVTPNAGKPGTVVQIFGKGFGASADQNTVSFSGAAASIASADPNRLVVAVPDTATTARISVLR